MQSKKETATVSLQVRLPVAEWTAFKMECLKQRVTGSAMIQHLLIAHMPAVAAAAKGQQAA